MKPSRGGQTGTMIKQGACNGCGQCCGGGNPVSDPGSPFPKGWPNSVRNWALAELEATEVFKFTNHPALGAPSYGSFKLGSNTIRWIWVEGVGLVKDMPPWGDPSNYVPECPLLGGESGGVFACLAEGQVWTRGQIEISGDSLRAYFGCRDIGLPDELPESDAAQWAADHPNCGVVYS